MPPARFLNAPTSVNASRCHLSCARPSVRTGVPLHKGGFDLCKSLKSRFFDDLISHVSFSRKSRRYWEGVTPSDFLKALVNTR